jgi:hypothetical protein
MRVCGATEGDGVLDGANMQFLPRTSTSEKRAQ